MAMDFLLQCRKQETEGKGPFKHTKKTKKMNLVEKTFSGSYGHGQSEKG